MTVLQCDLPLYPITLLVAMCVFSNPETGETKIWLPVDLLTSLSLLGFNAMEVDVWLKSCE